MTENVTLNFEPETTRHKFGIPSVTGGISHARTRINKLSRSTDKSFTGTTYVEGVVGQCRLHVFDSNFHFLHTRLSNLDGTYEVNNIYNDGKFYIVCVSLDEECPAISGHLIPPNASFNNAPTITLLGVDEVIPKGKRYEGYLLRASTTTVDPYQDEFDVNVISDPDYIKNYSQTKDIGLFGYQHDHATAAILPALLPKTINEFDQNASYLLQGSNGNWTGDKCDGVIEFIDINGNMVVELEIIGDAGQFRHNLKYRTASNPTQITAPWTGTYPRVGGDISFTNDSLIFVNNRPSNYINDFTINPVNVNDIVGMRLTVTDVRSNYLSANGGRAFLEFYMDAEYIPVIGATANDPEDGIIGSIVTEIKRDGVVVPSIDVDVVGTNIITYSVTDSDNETVQAIQTIIVESYEDYILSLLPVAHYNFNEISGTVANDSSVNVNHGIYEGLPSLNETSLFTETTGTSILLDGSDDAISTPIQSFSSDYTIIFFANVNNTSTQSLIRSFDRHIVQWNTNDTITFYQFTGSVHGQVVTPTLNLNETYHIVCKKEGTNNHVFVNGVKYSASGAVDIVDSNNFFIGRRPASSSEHVGGYMDEVSFFDRALTDIEVASIFDKI